MTDAVKFPSDWPENCPPSDAVECGMEFYRAVEAFPDAAEFKTAFQNGKFKKVCPCLRRGLSVLESLQAALHHTSLFPKRKIIILALVDQQHGKAKSTPSKTQPKHWTWWPPEGLDPISVFKVHEGL